MTGQAADGIWLPSAPPAAEQLLQWQLADVAELPAMRRQVRRTLEPTIDPDALDQIILALDEMASNALRHGGVGQVEACVRSTATGYLIEVTDCAASRPPTPAIDRDPSEGGLGLYLIARMALRHGWYASARAKHVWALLPRS
ncbi:ATP-binding protein [Blastococcus sp. TF02-09]|uniref:ATP-binding protein n=1 Tax=Blastococcus sp. TF02-09 TaxID=2250576 RepID=UPI000DEBC5F8|nr:ATP-binding protein [Blastococcus sp. TF02-9]RBY75848.1 ATP-binding protein [Blastococcus sp. TF02-9]